MVVPYIRPTGRRAVRFLFLLSHHKRNAWQKKSIWAVPQYMLVIIYLYRSHCPTDKGYDSPEYCYFHQRAHCPQQLYSFL